MGQTLIAYVAAAAAAASHAGAPPTGATAALAARPLHGSVVLRARPDGPAVGRVGPRAMYGAPLVLGVVGIHGQWLKVTTQALPNGHYSWVRFGSDVAVEPLQWRIRVSLSRRRLDVLRDSRVVRSIPVGVGRSDSPTPVGRFAVAEKFTGSFGPAFGTHLLVLTARQPRLPPGWNANVTYYVAIHTGAGEGTAVSAGCLHVTAADAGYLTRTVPLGTPVQISP